MTGRVFSVNTGKEKGGPKEMVRSCAALENFGLEGDAHAGPGPRQISVLSMEEIEKVESSCLSSGVDFRPGVFAENITTEGIDLSKIRVGDALKIGSDVVLRVTQIGKECREGCSIMKQVGRCIMPKQGIFATVERGGTLRVHDRIIGERHD